MTLTQITEKGIKDGEIVNADINASAAITSSKLAKPIDFADNEKARFGTGNDLEIYHDGSNSFIKNNSGQLELSGPTNAVTSISQLKLVDGEAVLRGKAGENSVRCLGDNRVELYFDNSKKLETTSSGITVTNHFYPATDNSSDLGSSVLRFRNQYISGSGVIDFLDGGKIQMGNSDDLQIYHDGSNSYIQDGGTGALVLLTSTFALKNAANNENIISGFENGAVELYYDNSKKFETTSAGATVTGALTTTSDITIQGGNDLNVADSGKAKFGDGNDLQIYHDGSNSRIHDAGTGILAISGSEVHIQNNNNSQSVAKFLGGTTNSSAELYYNDSKKFETTSLGAKTTGNHTFESGGGNAYFATMHSNGSTRFYIYDYPDASTVQMGTYTSSHIDFLSSGTQRVRLQHDGHLVPYADDTYNLGSSNLRWANVYTADFHLSNKGSSNDVDGTWGDWTIQEGESDLFLKNNRSGKKYKFNLTEIS